MKQIAVLNQSSHISSQDAHAMVQAVAQQMTRHLAPAWGRIAVPVVLLTSPSQITQDTRPIYILDNPDEPGALGYHTEERGKVYGRVFVKPVLDNQGVVLYDAKNPQNVSVASVLSHEVCEMFVDPSVNSWVDGPQLTQGSEYALEVGDPVESDGYTIQVGSAPVSVSNFVFPEWFDVQSPLGKRLDQMGRCTHPFTMTPGGYLVIRNGPGTEQQIFGEMIPHWKIEAKKEKTSRTQKRSTSR